MPFLIKTNNRIDKVPSSLEVPSSSFLYVKENVARVHYKAKEIPLRNLAVNGDFRIRQRGDTDAPDMSSCWQVGVDVSTSVTWDDASPAGFKLRRVVTAENDVVRKFGVAIKTEFTNSLKETIAKGIYITLSLFVKSNRTSVVVYCYTPEGVLYTNTITLSPDTWQYITSTYWLDDSMFTDLDALSHIQFVGISFGSDDTTDPVNLNDYFEVKFMQAEIGKFASTYDNIPFDVQLAYCRRYLYNSLYSHFDVTEIKGTMPTFAYNQYEFNDPYFQLPVTMRSIPSVTTIARVSGTVGAVRDEAGTDVPIDIGPETSPSQLHWYSSAGNLTPGNFYRWHFIADARL